jgi:hypothetical protein
MNKVGILVAAAALAAGLAQAGSYSVQQHNECPLVSATELSKTVQNAGGTTGLDLPKDMVLRTELRCALDAKSSSRYVYTIRASLEKQVGDGWAPVAQLTRYGTTSASTALLREVHFTARDLIRQEP